MKTTLTSEILNNLKKESYYNEADFIKDAKEYIAAVKSGRILYTVTHVSVSGMSRKINIKSFEGKISKGFYRNYYAMLKAMGYKFGSGDNDLIANGFGMNMLFKTNYDIVMSFYRMGFITKKTSDILAQKVN